MDDYERPCEEHPLKPMTHPAPHFLNLTFTGTPTARLNPSVRVHGQAPCHRGRQARSHRQSARLRHALLDDCSLPGTLPVEDIWQSARLMGGIGVNSLVMRRRFLPMAQWAFTIEPFG